MIKTAIASFMNSHNGRAQPSILHRAGRLHAGEEVLTSDRTPAGTQVGDELGQPRAENVTNSSGVEVFAQNLGNRDSNAFPADPCGEGNNLQETCTVTSHDAEGHASLYRYKKKTSPHAREFAATPMPWVPATRWSDSLKSVEQILDEVLSYHFFDIQKDTRDVFIRYAQGQLKDMLPMHTSIEQASMMFSGWATRYWNDSAIQQLREGLKLFALLNVLESEPQLTGSLLRKSATPVISDDIVQAMDVKWTDDGGNRKESQKDVYQRLTTWLKKVTQCGEQGLLFADCPVVKSNIATEVARVTYFWPYDEGTHDADEGIALPDATRAVQNFPDITRDCVQCVSPNRSKRKVNLGVVDSDLSSTEGVIQIMEFLHGYVPEWQGKLYPIL
ncbi:hypothetical protein Bbelb_018250 [Branchiostoma belcheri]|nr:hypothetical protein Bbelb_018250 [Branchiostoma belcheri]